MEWAEAYAADNPGCVMGQVYLDFLRRELVTAQGESNSAGYLALTLH